VEFTDARAQLVGTAERLLGMVRCLETLSALVPTVSNPEYIAKAAALRQALQQAPSDVRTFAEELLNRPPSAGTRFTATATSLTPSDLDAHLRLFREAWAVRSSILHGSREPELTPSEEAVLSPALDALAIKYLKAFVARFRADAVARGAVAP
jgi:hypothetical protein